jgi:RNA polymerase sigma-70 factor (ECF subfamily)
MLDPKIIQALKKEDRVTQEWLYKNYSAIFLSLCRRYLRNLEEAEDAMIQGFYKIMTNIDQYNNQGSFEGWMRRIVVNESLMILRKRNNFHLTIDLNLVEKEYDWNVIEQMAYNEILNLLSQLPEGYRTVFNLYVIEGYKHREIAEILGISINTSKSQLIQARKKLQLLLKKKQMTQTA